MTFFLIAVLSYLLGSIPFGYILVRVFHRQDVRQTGSGNIGATNVARSSPLLGALTLLLDAAKGYAAVTVTTLAGRLWYPELGLPASTLAIRAATAAFFAILGHMFPPWLNFKGGKGVATALGSFIILAPRATLATAGIFAATVLVFRYVSLGSILAVALFPFLAWQLRDYADTPLVLAFVSLASVMIVIRHRENIARLLAGTERRFQLRRG